MKTSSNFLQVLDKINAKIESMRKLSDDIHVFYKADNIVGAYERAFKLEAVSEQAVLLTRRLPAYTGSPTADIVLDEVLRENIPVKIEFTVEGWFCLSIPSLLPKKSEGSTEYIRSYLYPAMRDFFINRDPVRHKDCVLIYRHIYDRARPERKRRDHDNFEINMVSDIVALYVMPDDGPSVCSHFYCSADGTDDCTEVYVVPRYDFPHWLSKYYN